MLYSYIQQQSVYISYRLTCTCIYLNSLTILLLGVFVYNRPSATDYNAALDLALRLSLPLCLHDIYQHLRSPAT